MGQCGEDCVCIARIRVLQRDEQAVGNLPVGRLTEAGVAGAYLLARAAAAYRRDSFDVGVITQDPEQHHPGVSGASQNNYAHLLPQLRYETDQLSGEIC